MVLLPFIPIQPGWVRLPLSLIWVVWVLADPSRRVEEDYDDTVTNVDQLLGEPAEFGGSSRFD